MPYSPPATNAAVTSGYFLANVSNQVISSVTASGRPAGTESQMIGVTDTDRYEAYSGAAWIRMMHWSTAGRTGFKLRRVATQAITTATDTTISFDTEDFDSDGFITVTSDTMTIPTGLDGLYDGLLMVAFATNPGVNGNIRFETGGVTGDYRLPTGNSTVSYQALALGIPNIDLSATNTLKARVYQASGGTINITASLAVFRKFR